MVQQLRLWSLCGSKVSDKLDVILSLIERCNDILIGGAMAYTFLKYKGHAVGNSRVEEDKMSLVEMIYRNAEQRGVRFIYQLTMFVRLNSRNHQSL